MKFILRLLLDKNIKHKLKYSKTIKVDYVSAFFGLSISIIAAYLALASVGGSSVDLYDCLVFSWYLYIFIFLCMYLIVLIWV